MATAYLLPTRIAVIPALLKLYKLIFNFKKPNLVKKMINLTKWNLHFWAITTYKYKTRQSPTQRKMATAYLLPTRIAVLSASLKSYKLIFTFKKPC